ncbi:MAG: L,D-transpeptidase family protein [Planctomycetia bacterium]|nr:L,D-transpeptidase family protein [Planctomycetia bacterium]
MPISHKSPYRRHVFGALAVCLAGVALIAARQQGWLGASADPDPFAADRMSLVDVEPPPPPEDDMRMPSEIDLAQSEPEDLENAPEIAPTRAPKAKSAKHTQWESSSSPVFEREDDIDGSSRGAKSRVVAAGFEDEAPVAPGETEDEEAVDRRPAAPAKDAVARKSTDTTRAAVQAEPIEPDQARKPPLMNGDKIQALIDEGNYIDAQRELSQWYWQKPDKRDEILPQLNKLARALYFSPQPQYYDQYIVKPGDQLRMVGQRYKLSWEYIAKLNNVDAKKIRAGQKLKVVPGPFAAIVFLDRFELVVHVGGNFVKSYRVGVGKDGTTPVGKFAVKNKMVDPTYYGPEGGSLAHDDPANPLGERWIDIGDHYGIHGTIDPASIGKKESRGCIRMLNSDVEEVYDFLVIGSEVKIVRK